MGNLIYGYANTWVIDSFKYSMKTWLIEKEKKKKERKEKKRII